MFSRDEFSSYLVEHNRDVTNVGRVMAFCDSVLQLQNDMSRPIYVFEVDPNITEAELEYLDRVVNEFGLACVVVPRHIVRYVGEVDSDSMGVPNYKMRVMGKSMKGRR